MDEAKVEEVNKLFDAMVHRLEARIIKDTPAEFKETCTAICDIFAMKENLRNNEYAAAQSEKLMKIMQERLKRGDGGISFGPPPGPQNPFPPQPPQQPVQGPTI